MTPNTRSTSRRWMEQALRRSRFEPERQVVALAVLGFVIALILGALYLSQVATEAAINNELRQMQAERDDLERVNEELRAEIAELKSVPRLEARALEMGFAIADSSRIEWLPVVGYRPAEPETVAPVEAGADAPPVDTYTETFGVWLGRQWAALRDAFDRLFE